MLADGTWALIELNSTWDAGLLARAVRQLFHPPLEGLCRQATPVRRQRKQCFPLRVRSDMPVAPCGILVFDDSNRVENAVALAFPRVTASPTGRDCCHAPNSRRDPQLVVRTLDVFRAESTKPV